jgi:ABC-type uncharacterized transport system substrate-binding protein
MRQSLARALALLVIAPAAPALAHPHVWISAKAAIVYTPDGRVEAVAHEWTFDRGYSSFAVQGLEGGDGLIAKDKLAELAKTNVESLAEFGFFTQGKANGSKLSFGGPRDYELVHKDGSLTLRFVLPLSAPAKADRAFALDLYDPTFFVDFRLTEGPDAVRLVGAPAGCALNVGRPKPTDAPDPSLSETFWAGVQNAGARFSNRVLVACP